MRYHTVGGIFTRVMNMMPAAVLAAGLCAGFTPGALAQDVGETELQEIVIEGVSLADEGVSGDKLGSAVSVVTRAQLEAQQIRHVADALRSMPGVSVGRSGAFSGLTQIRLRGNEGNHTLVLIDGIKVNDTTTGEFDFSSLSTDQIERIEVIRGAQSGVWGSNALGGVINIITRRGEGPLALQLKAETGSFSTRDGGVTLSGGSKSFHGQISYNVQRSEGFNVAPSGGERDGSALKTFALRGGMVLTDSLSVSVALRNMRKSGGRDSEGGPAGTLAVQVDNPSHFASDQWIAGAEARLELLDGKWVHKLIANHNSVGTEDTSVSAFGTSLSENDGAANKYSYLNTLRIDMPDLLQSRHFVTGLVEFEEEFFTPEKIAGQFFTGDGIERVREHIGYVAEYRGEFFDRLFMTANIRFDDNDTFDDQTTWRTTGAVKLSDIETGPLGIRLHGSAGTAVKNPKMSEQFGFIPLLFTPNPALTPEESFAWDLGAELKMLDGKIVFDVTYFEADLENMIATRFLPNFTSTAVNLPGISDRKGIEIAARMQVTPDLVLSGAYTWLKATEPTGVREIRRPEHSGRIDLDSQFDQGRGKIHAAVIYNGEAQDIAFRLPFFSVERVTLDEYWLVSLAASYEVKQGIELFGRVENAFDEDYREVYGFDTAGASVYGGIKVRFAADEVAD